MFIIFHLFLIFIILFYSNLPGTIYYVSVSGNDDNNGTSQDKPWQNCPEMQGWSGNGSLFAGDTVYFNSGDTWEVSGGVAVLQVTGGVLYDGKTWGTGTRAILCTKGNLTRSVIAILKDHPTIPTVVRGFEVDAGGTITTGIGINHPQMENPLLGATKRIEECVIHDVTSFSAQNTYKYGIVISNWNGEYHVKNVEIMNCQVYNISRGGINLYPGNDIPDNLVENVLVRGNEVWATGMDPDYAGSCLAIKNHVVNAVVEYNYLHDPIRGIGMGVSTHPEEGFIGPRNAIIRHNIIANSKHAGMYITSWGPVSLAIYGNIIINSAYHAINLTNNLRDSLSIRIYNNTMVNNYPGSQWAEQIRISCNEATVSALEVSNNLIYTTDSTRAILDDYGLITSHINNLYYKSIGGTLVIVDGVTYTASNITTWEQTAVVENPLFYSVSSLPSGFTGTYNIDMRPNTDGLTLAESSPAKDNGSTLGDSFKSSINTTTRPYGDAWDIGAYEYNGIIAIHPKQDKPTKSKDALHITTNNSGVIFTYTGFSMDASVISIYHVSGRLIQELTLDASVVIWDGRIRNGDKCPAGCYIAHITNDNYTRAQRFIFYR